MVPEIDLNTFAAAHAAGASVLDVREPFEYVAGHVPGAVHIPLGELGARYTELAQDRPLYVICRSGNRSGHAAHRRSGVDIAPRPVAPVGAGEGQRQQDYDGYHDENYGPQGKAPTGHVGHVAVATSSLGV